jgi:methylenetetrahydrofolate reductase (NADPH)
MRIKNLFEEKNLVYSFEIFPPRPNYPLESIYSPIDELSQINPDYISVTYGAGGSTQNNRTAMLSSLIKNKHQIESVAHLTCIGATRDNIDKILDELEANKVENVLALRGDIPSSGLVEGDFKNSQELISYIKERDNFGIAAGKIHSDMERGFIRAETISIDDLMACGSMAAAREKGLIRIEGKDYIMQDGDVVLFRFNV